MRETIYRFGGFELKSSERILRRNRALVPLPPKAIATLLFLLEADGRVVSKAELLDAVWPGTFVDEGNLPQTISVLRKGLDLGFPDSSPIETVARVGYMFRAAVEVVTLPDPGQGTPEILPAASPELPSDAPGEIPAELLTPADMQLSPSRPTSHNLYTVALILGCLAVALLIFLPLRSFFRPPQPASRAFSTPVPLTAGSGWEFSPAISPDGKTLAYSARRDGEAAYSIYLKHLGSGEDGQRLDTGPGSAFHAAWSPDGKRIAFFGAALHANWLQILDLDTGAIHKVLQLPEWGAPAPLPISESYWVGPIWTRDAASLIYSHNPGIGSASVLEQIDLASGRVRSLTHNTDGWYDGSPALSPDGRSIAFIHNLTGQARLEVLSLQTLQRIVVSEPWHLLNGAAWMPDGRSLVVAGSRNGGPDGTRSAIWRVRLDGRFTQLVQDRPDMIVSPAVSADGKTIAYAEVDRQVNMALVPDLQGTSRPRLLYPSRSIAEGAAIAPDGNLLAYVSDRSGQTEVWVAPLADDPQAQPRQLTHGLGGGRGEAIWSADSRTIAATLNPNGRNIIELIDVATGTFAPLQTPNVDSSAVCCPAFSRDGRWIFAWVNHGPAERQYRFSIGPVPLAEPVPGLMNPDAYFEDLDWSYFVGKDRSGFFRQRFATPADPNPQPEAIAGLADVVPGEGWQIGDGGILFIDFNSAVRTLKRWDAKTGKIEELTGPLPRVDSSQDFSYNRQKHFLVYPQYRDNAGSQILALREPR